MKSHALNLWIKWTFNPPHAPHFGGVFEILQLKEQSHAILSRDDEELLTAFCGAESLNNSRPITYQSANESPKQWWQRVQKLVRHFWHRWLKEWIPSLSPRQKWYRLKMDLKPGDCVLMNTPNTPRGLWPLGRVLEVYKGKLQVGSGQYLRPIVKVCPLE